MPYSSRTCGTVSVCDIFLSNFISLRPVLLIPCNSELSFIKKLGIEIEPKLYRGTVKNDSAD